MNPIQPQIERPCGCGKKKATAPRALLPSRPSCLEIEASRPATEDVFLTLLDATAAQADAPPSTAKLLHQGGAVGAEVKTADSVRTVLFHPDGRASIDGMLVLKRSVGSEDGCGEQEKPAPHCQILRCCLRSGEMPRLYSAPQGIRVRM